MAKTTKKSELPELQAYFVPGVGYVEAKDVDDLDKQLKKLDEQEDGDGNR